MKEKYNFKALIRNCDPKDYFSIAEKLDSSDFDEKIEINLKDKTYRMLTHTDNKFMGNMLQGDFNRLYNFAIESFVHPDDAKSYKEIADPDTLKERLAAEDKKGVISGVFRIKGTDDNWIDTHQFFISGKIFGGIQFCFGAVRGFIRIKNNPFFHIRIGYILVFLKIPFPDREKDVFIRC